MEDNEVLLLDESFNFDIFELDLEFVMIVKKFFKLISDKLKGKIKFVVKVKKY